MSGCGTRDLTLQEGLLHVHYQGWMGRGRRARSDPIHEDNPLPYSISAVAFHAADTPHAREPDSEQPNCLVLRDAMRAVMGLSRRPGLLYLFALAWLPRGIDSTESGLEDDGVVAHTIRTLLAPGPENSWSGEAAYLSTAVTRRADIGLEPYGTPGGGAAAAADSKVLNEAAGSTVVAQAGVVVATRSDKHDNAMTVRVHPLYALWAMHLYEAANYHDEAAGDDCSSSSSSSY
jgi:hypothetical protein